MLFKGFILKIALKIVWNVWSIQALHTGGEAFLPKKCTGIPTAHKYFGLETTEEVVTPYSHGFPLELDTFYHKSHLPSHLLGFCFQFMLKS